MLIASGACWTVKVTANKRIAIGTGCVADFRRVSGDDNHIPAHASHCREDEVDVLVDLLAKKDWRNQDFVGIDTGSRSQLCRLGSRNNFKLQFTYAVSVGAALTNLSIVRRPDTADFPMSTLLTTPGPFTDAFCRWFLRHFDCRNIKRTNSSPIVANTSPARDLSLPPCPILHPSHTSSFIRKIQRLISQKTVGRDRFSLAVLQRTMQSAHTR
ncbi:hypothetical protein KCU59_g134, partial [Aureobasidium melanogenum]